MIVSCVGPPGNAASTKIDQALKKEAKANRQLNARRLVLAGPRASGKSTLLKQIQLLQEGGFNSEVKKNSRQQMWENSVEYLDIVVKTMERLNVPFEKAENSQHLEAFNRYITSGEKEIKKEVFESVRCLWGDGGLQKCCRHSRALRFQSGIKLLDSLEKIIAQDYSPTNDEVLMAYEHTKVISESCFISNGVTINVYDGLVTGIRNPWVQYFDDAHAIMYVADISIYDEQEGPTGGLGPSIEMFEAICNNPLLINVTIFLLLNKTDVVQEKLDKLPFKKYFPKYTGNQDYKSVISYFKSMYKQVNQNPDRKIYIYEMTAIDTEQSQKSITSTFKFVQEKQLTQRDYRTIV